MGFTVWLTGRPCSGKTTIAKFLEQELKSRGYRVMHLDGDTLRKGLNVDLGFSVEDRNENLRRVAHVAQLFNAQGITVLASFVSPMNHQRKMIAEIIGDMKLVYVNAPGEVCEERDVKGMYRLAREGKIKQFTGVDDPFEEPVNPHLEIDSHEKTVKENMQEILEAFF